MRKFLLVPWLLLLGYCILPAFAQVTDLTINGDAVTYSRDNEQVEATGSVEVVYRSTKLTGGHVVYNTRDERMLADQGFVLFLENVTIEGRQIDFKIKEQSGQARNVDFAYDGTIVHGQKIDLARDIYKLEEASFTTCDLARPHYQVTAREIILYPEDGWLVANWGVIWLGRVPVFPVPAYIYNVYGAAGGKRNTLPFPQIGSNDEDGAYISQKLAWHWSRQLSGSYAVSYFEKKGLGGGLEADYELNKDNRGNIRMSANPANQYYGGLTHTWDFGGEIERQPLLGLARQPKIRQFDLETTLAYHERLNYERVSYYPKFILRTHQGHLFNSALKYDLEAGLAMIAEVGTTKLGQGLGVIKLYSDLIDTPLAKIVPYLIMDSRFYSDGSRWLRNLGGVGLERAFSERLAGGVGYLRYLLNSGASPFNFELYRFNPSDRLTGSLQYKYNGSGLAFDASYYLDSGSPEDLDYSLHLSLHCYDLMLKYRSLRREFSVGLSFGK